MTDLESILGSPDSQSSIIGREASAGLQIEPPSMQRAHQFAVVDLAENAEIGLAMRAQPLDDVVADADLLTRQITAQGIEAPPGFRLGATHALRRERLEEVVE